MILLHRLDLVAGFFDGGDAAGGGQGAGNRGHDGCAGIDGGGADLDFIGARRGTARRVDDELQLLVFKEVDGVGTAFLQLVDAFDLQTRLLQGRGRAAGGDELESEFGKLPGDFDNLFLVLIADADEDLAPERQRASYMGAKNGRPWI